jgi:hypothetical protein
MENLQQSKADPPGGMCMDWGQRMVLNAKFSPSRIEAEINVEN